jgi:TonB family protein
MIRSQSTGERINMAPGERSRILDTGRHRTVKSASRAASSTALLAAVWPVALHAQAIGGRVLEQPRGAPLAGVRTSARLPGSDSAVVATTGRDGTFILVLPRAGRYQIHFALDSLTDFASDSIDVGPDDFVQKEFRLTPSAPVFFEFQVQQPVIPLPGNTGPRYPTTLKERNIEGDVIAQFIVDTSGYVRPGSFRALRWSDFAFVQAVREAVSTMRFRPAELDGRKVSQLVQQPFQFRLTGGPLPFGLLPRVP